MTDEATPDSAFSPKPRRGFGWRRALSELAIIVIGVLITLAVNNWAALEEKIAHSAITSPAESVAQP